MPIKTKLFRVLAVLGLVTLAAVTARADETATFADDWAHRMWIAKAGKALSAGMPLSAAEVETLAPLSREQVVEQLMARPEFGDAVLDFNLFFLGYKPARLYTPAREIGDRDYDYHVYAKPQAIAAAQAVVRGGDYFDLFNIEQPKFFAPLMTPYILSDEDSDAPPDTRTDDEKRAVILQTAMTAIDRLTGNFHAADGTLNKAEGCRLRGEDEAAEEALNGLIYNGGILFIEQIDLILYKDIDINIACGTPTFDAQHILDIYADLKSTYEALYARLPSFKRDTYVTRSVMDMKPLPDADRYPLFKGSQFGFFGFWNDMPNSSTNYNRKRAAYVLKTYFCDDLTPLGVVPGDDSHPGDRHASEPGCQSCHYKLDPMAGFFKDYGVLGIDLSSYGFHVFDDNAVIDGDRLAAYRASWPVIGYVRSPRDPSLSDLGQTLPDLYGILRRAPEVRQCLVRRMAEYYLGKDQVFDGGWLEHLTTEFNQEAAAAPSSGAVKTLMKQLVLSNTFTEPDPAADQCYDYYPSNPGPTAVPCAVAHVVRNNCVRCHRNTSPTFNGLDMSRWIEVGRDAQGQPIMSFPHLAPDGTQIDKATTFARLEERLNSADPERAMPLNMDMNAVEKARLYLWVRGQQ